MSEVINCDDPKCGRFFATFFHGAGYRLGHEEGVFTGGTQRRCGALRAGRRRHDFPRDPNAFLRVLQKHESEQGQCGGRVSGRQGRPLGISGSTLEVKIKLSRFSQIYENRNSVISLIRLFLCTYIGTTIAFIWRCDNPAEPQRKQINSAATQASGTLPTLPGLVEEFNSGETFKSVKGLRWIPSGSMNLDKTKLMS